MYILIKIIIVIVITIIVSLIGGGHRDAIRIGFLGDWAYSQHFQGSIIYIYIHPTMVLRGDRCVCQYPYPLSWP